MSRSLTQNSLQALIWCECLSTFGNSQDLFKYQTCLSEVSFSGTPDIEYLTIRKDNNVEDYLAPHYKVEHLVCGLGFTGTVVAQKPVAYVSGTKGKVRAVFKTNCSQPIVIRGRGINDAQGFNLPNQILYPSGGEYIYNTREFGSSFTPFIVQYLQNFTIVWEYATNISNPTNWMLIDQSDNTIFVTHKPPIIEPFIPLYHSVFYNACKYANNYNNEADIVSGIKTRFNTKYVETYDNILLTYWRPNAPDNGFCHYTKDLLLNKNGQCAAWASFFEDCGRVHQIEIDYYDIKSNFSMAEKMAAMEKIFNDYGNLVIIEEQVQLSAKNWNTNQEYAYLGQNDDIDVILNSDAGGEPGVSAQGTEIYGYEPRSIFEAHSINKFNSKFYDPSYGRGPIDNEVEYEDNSIDIVCGYLFKDVSSLPAKWYIYIAKKNTNVKDLQFIKI